MKVTESKGKPAPEPRRQYDETFKRHAVELTLQGHRRVTKVAQELGVPESMLGGARFEHTDVAGVGSFSDPLAPVGGEREVLTRLPDCPGPSSLVA